MNAGLYSTDLYIYIKELIIRMQMEELFLMQQTYILVYIGIYLIFKLN